MSLLLESSVPSNKMRRNFSNSRMSRVCLSLSNYDLINNPAMIWDFFKKNLDKGP